MRNLRREEPAAKHILQKGIHTVQETAAFSADNKVVFFRAVEKALLRQRFNPRDVYKRQMQDDTPSSSSNEADKYLLPVRHALSYVQTHYSERVTLQELADAAGYSVYYFCKLFKEITQLTPMPYLSLIHI